MSSNIQSGLNPESLFSIPDMDIELSKFNRIELCYIAQDVSGVIFKYGRPYDNNVIHFLTSYFEKVPVIRHSHMYPGLLGNLEAIEMRHPDGKTNNEYYFHQSNIIKIDKYVGSNNNIRYLAKYIDNTSMHILPGIDLNNRTKYIYELPETTSYDITKVQWNWYNSAGVNIYTFEISVKNNENDEPDNREMKYTSYINIPEITEITAENREIITNVQSLVHKYIGSLRD
jgi:hypothetical protein